MKSDKLLHQLARNAPAFAQNNLGVKEHIERSSPTVGQGAMAKLYRLAMAPVPYENLTSFGKVLRRISAVLTTLLFLPFLLIAIVVSDVRRTWRDMTVKNDEDPKSFTESLLNLLDALWKLAIAIIVIWMVIYLPYHFLSYPELWR